MICNAIRNVFFLLFKYLSIADSVDKNSIFKIVILTVIKYPLQIRIEGTVERLSEDESIEYFHLRPIASQIGACVSHQSEPVQSREVSEVLAL